MIFFSKLLTIIFEYLGKYLIYIFDSFGALNDFLLFQNIITYSILIIYFVFNDKLKKIDAVTFKKMKFPNSTLVLEGIAIENIANNFIQFFVNSSFDISNVYFSKNNVSSII